MKDRLPPSVFRLLFAGLGLVACIMLWAFLCSRTIEQLRWWAGFIEVFNGATWPDQWWKNPEGPYVQGKPWFVAFVVARSVLNAGAPIAVIGSAAYLIYLGKRMKMSLAEALELRDAELLSAAFVAFEACTNITLTDDQRDFISKRAKSVQSTWAEKTIVIAPGKEDQPRT